MASRTDTEEIVQHALRADLIGPAKRTLLLDGLPMGFVYSLPTVSRPIDQLRFDLMELARTPRLIGLADPPLAIWLRNAAKLSRPRTEASFFDRAASALDGKPPEHAAADAHVGSGSSNTVGQVSSGSVGIVHGPVVINNHAAPAPRPGATEATGAQAPSSTERPRLHQPLIAVGLGVTARDAEDAARPHASAISAARAIEVPSGTWERAPTDGDWRLVAHRIEVMLSQIGPDVSGDIALVARDDTPPAMLAWFIVCARRRTARTRRVHVFDPDAFAGGDGWRPLAGAGGAGSDGAITATLEPDGTDTAGDAITLHVDLGAPAVRRDPSVVAAERVRLTVADGGWRRGKRTADALAESFEDAVHTLQERYAGARWHVFYDGPPSLWCQMVGSLLASRQPATLYAIDVDGREHPALELPAAKWVDPRDPQGRLDGTYDVYLAYPPGADDLAALLYESLSPNYKVFFDARSLLPGDLWSDVRPAAQASALATLLLITPDTDGAWWQRSEIISAVDLAGRPDGRHRVIPLLARGVSNGKLPFGLERLTAAEWVEGESVTTVIGRLRAALDRARAAAAPTEAGGA